MAVFGSFVKFWPYNLSLTLNHYTYGFEEAGVEHAYRNSLDDGGCGARCSVRRSPSPARTGWRRRAARDFAARR